VRPEVRRPSEPFPATAAETAPAPSLAERIAELNGRLRDVHFAYDRSDLSNESLAVLDDNSGLLKPMLAEFPGLVIAVEGHCDERGSAEYNLGLGDRRAAGVSEHLQKLGVAAGRLRTISYGKEAPLCTEPTEACHARNRRAHFAARAADAP
jgi:peptidoglycan-associated lipoprotein